MTNNFHRVGTVSTYLSLKLYLHMNKQEARWTFQERTWS